MPKTLLLKKIHRTRIKSHDLSIRIDESTLNRSTNTKYIGVIIDHKLNWYEHIAHVKKKVSNGISILYKARPFLWSSRNKY